MRAKVCVCTVPDRFHWLLKFQFLVQLLTGKHLTFHSLYILSKLFNQIYASRKHVCVMYTPPTEPHFYTAKLGYAGVYLFFFLFLLQSIDCGYSLEPPLRGGSNMYPQSICFEQKNIKIFLLIFFFFFFFFF